MTTFGKRMWEKRLCEVEGMAIEARGAVQSIRDRLAVLEAVKPAEATPEEVLAAVHSGLVLPDNPVVIIARDELAELRRKANWFDNVGGCVPQSVFIDKQAARIDELTRELGEAQALGSYKMAVEWRNKCLDAERELETYKNSHEHNRRAHECLVRQRDANQAAADTLSDLTRRFTNCEEPLEGVLLRLKAAADTLAKLVPAGTTPNGFSVDWGKAAAERIAELTKRVDANQTDADTLERLKKGSPVDIDGEPALLIIGAPTLVKYLFDHEAYQQDHDTLERLWKGESITKAGIAGRYVLMAGDLTYIQLRQERDALAAKVEELDDQINRLHAQLLNAGNEKADLERRLAVAQNFGTLEQSEYDALRRNDERWKEAERQIHGVVSCGPAKHRYEIYLTRSGFQAGIDAAIAARKEATPSKPITPKECPDCGSPKIQTIPGCAPCCFACGREFDAVQNEPSPCPKCGNCYIRFPKEAMR